MKDPALRIFGAAAELTPGVLGGDSPPIIAERLEAERDALGPNVDDNSGTNPVFGVTVGRRENYELWVEQVKNAFGGIAMDLYSQLGISDSKYSEYLSMLDSMMGSILANPDDMFLSLIESDFKRSAYDMAINATRGDLTWQDVYHIFRPPPPEYTDDPGTLNYTQPSGVVADTTSWPINEQIYFGRHGSSLLHFYEEYPDLQLSSSAEEYYQQELAAVGVPPATPPETVTTPDVPDDEPQTELQKFNALGVVVQNLHNILAEVVSTYALSPDTILFLGKFNGLAFSLGYGLDPLPENTGITGTGSNSKEEQIRFIANSGLFDEETLYMFQSAAIQEGVEF